MLKTKNESIEAIQTIARTLGDLNNEVIFVGGAVATLYADDPGAPEIRPTKDVDIVVEIASQLELEKFRKQLVKRDIHFAQDSKITCRFRYQNIFIDIMATKEISWAPSNPWFKLGFDHHIIQELNDVKIKIMSVPYFLASKFTAFEDRGRDPRTSHDFEDIVYILDNRISLVNDILDSDLEVKKFLIARFSNLLKDESLVEAILAHLEPETQSQRFEILKQKLSIITS